MTMFGILSVVSHEHFEQDWNRSQRNIELFFFEQCQTHQSMTHQTLQRSFHLIEIIHLITYHLATVTGGPIQNWFSITQKQFMFSRSFVVCFFFLPFMWRSNEKHYDPWSIVGEQKHWKAKKIWNDILFEQMKPSSSIIWIKW